jgi:hypothetical protein
MMEFLKIVLGCIAAAILYGIVHDQVTVRVCAEYFTVFHPKIIESDNVTLIALSWGVVATWWMGVGIGFALGLSARWGSWPRRTWVQLMPSVMLLLGVMAFCAVACGVYGYLGGGLPIGIAEQLPAALYRRFAADWYAHMASYATGFFGGLGLCTLTLVQRYRTE